MCLHLYKFLIVLFLLFVCFSLINYTFQILPFLFANVLHSTVKKFINFCPYALTCHHDRLLLYTPFKEVPFHCDIFLPVVIPLLGSTPIGLYV